MTPDGIPTLPRIDQNPENDAGGARNGPRKTAIEYQNPKNP
jgi:hypothetical protein